MTKESRRSRTKGRKATLGVIEGRFAISVGLPDRPEPNGWRWMALSEIADLESGHTPSRKHPEYWDGTTPWISIADAVAHHGQTIQETFEHVSDEGLAHSSARLLPANTVCLSRTASVGYVVVTGCPMATSQDFVNWVCGSELEPDYLKYVLVAERESILRFATGTTHQTMYYPEAKALHVLLPSISEQRRILEVLQALDAKIDANRKMSEALEVISRSLYQSWFVDFDQVRAKSEGRPIGLTQAVADLFPDSFTDSVIGDVPSGWRILGLDEVARFLNGLAMQRFPTTGGRTLPVIKIAQLKSNSTAGADIATADIDGAYIVHDGDVLFSWSGSLECVLWTGAEGALNQHLFKVSSETYPKWFYYLAVRAHLDDFRRIAAGKATTMGHIQRHHLADAKVVVPPKDVLERLSTIVSPMVEKVILNGVEARVLGELRDALLPKLISGEIRLREVAGFQVERNSLGPVSLRS